MPLDKDKALMKIYTEHSKRQTLSHLTISIINQHYITFFVGYIKTDKFHFINFRGSLWDRHHCCPPLLVRNSARANCCKKLVKENSVVPGKTVKVGDLRRVYNFNDKKWLCNNCAGQWRTKQNWIACDKMRWSLPLSLR